MCGRTEEEAVPTVGLPTPHFAGFLNVPIQAPLSSANLFTFIPGNRPISVAFCDVHWDTDDIFSS